MATNALALLPGRNPAGTTVAGDYSISPAIGSTSGTNPMLTPNNLPSGAPATNPYSPGSVVPTGATGTGGIPSFPANSGPYTTTDLANPTGSPTSTGTSIGSAQSGALGGIFGGETQGGIDKLFSSLSKTYGTGIGSLLANFLTSGAGFNQDAINNIFAALQPQINQGTESLMEQFSTTGNRFGSGAQIGLSNFLSQVNLNEGQIESSMYEDAVNNFMNVLMGTGGQTAGRIANSPSTLDQIGSIGNLIGGGAAGVSQGISAANPGADTGILDTIASIGAGI
jgi:hypothetical protein